MQQALLVGREVLSGKKVLRFLRVSVAIDARVSALVQRHVAASFGIEEEAIVNVFGVDDWPAYLELLCLVRRILEL